MGDTERVQPAWVTVNVRPAMVSVPVRVVALPKLGATEKTTSPLPLPACPDVMVIQSELSVAVQSQPSGAVTAAMAP